MRSRTVNIMNQMLKDEIMMREMLDDDGPLGMDSAPDDAAVDAALRAVRSKLARTLGRARRPLARIGVIDSPVGRLLVAESARGLLAVQFLDVPEAPDALAALREGFDLVEDADVAARIGREIERYLNGDMHALDRPVDLSLVRTDFQRRALMRLRRAVPPGSVITYQALAAAGVAPRVVHYSRVRSLFGLLLLLKLLDLAALTFELLLLALNLPLLLLSCGL